MKISEKDRDKLEVFAWGLRRITGPQVESEDARRVLEHAARVIGILSRYILRKVHGTAGGERRS